MGVLNVIGVTAVLLLFLTSMQSSEGGRLLHDEEENSTKNKLLVLMESKQNANRPPGGPNPPTNIPGPANPTSGHAASTVNQRNFAGHTTTENLKIVSMESKQKAPLPPGGPNPPTNIPGPANPTSGHAASTINQRNFAGHTTTENLKIVSMESKQKAPLPPGGPNPPTNIPGPATPTSGHAASTINQRNFAGHNTTENLKIVSMESKQKAPLPPGGPNPPTNIPGPATPTSGHAASTINQRNFAGHTTTENSMKSKLLVSMASKQRPIPPPGGPNPPTNKPGPTTPTSGYVASTINQRNFAGHSTTENSMKNKLFVSMASKQRPIPPPGGPNGHTNKPAPPPPTRGHVASTINQINFAGLLHMPTLTSGF